MNLDGSWEEKLDSFYSLIVEGGCIIMGKAWGGGEGGGGGGGGGEASPLGLISACIITLKP